MISHDKTMKKKKKWKVDFFFLRLAFASKYFMTLLSRCLHDRKTGFWIWKLFFHHIVFYFEKTINLAKLSKFLGFFYFQIAIIGQKYGPIGRYLSQIFCLGWWHHKKKIYSGKLGASAISCFSDSSVKQQNKTWKVSFFFLW